MADEIKTGGRRRRRANRTKKHRGGFIGDLMLAAAAVGAAVYGRKRMSGVRGGAATRRNKLPKRGPMSAAR